MEDNWVGRCFLEDTDQAHRCPDQGHAEHESLKKALERHQLPNPNLVEANTTYEIPC